ncbi:MAG: NTP transferase domain-containing protein, partial [Bacteroidota bacterium]
LDDGITEISPLLAEHIGTLRDLPILRISDTEAITQVVLQYMQHIPPIKGLVFAGGQSIRMGRDKGAINYHGKPQREHMADILSEFTENTYLSVRESANIKSNYPLLPDTFHDLGPFGGLLSAFRQDPDAAWLAVACDVPLVDRDVISQLTANRDTSQTATCFHNPHRNLPEPMLALWEPRAYQRLLQFLALGYSCPQKVLINSPICELDTPDPSILTNVNTPSDYEAVQTLIA